MCDILAFKNTNSFPSENWTVIVCYIKNLGLINIDMNHTIIITCMKGIIFVSLMLSNFLHNNNHSSQMMIHFYRLRFENEVVVATVVSMFAVVVALVLVFDTIVIYVDVNLSLLLLI